MKSTNGQFVEMQDGKLVRSQGICMKHSHGGWRDGAGRPNLSGKANHMKRPQFRGLSQLHLKFSLAPDIRNLKKKKTLRLIKRALINSNRFHWRVHSLGIEKTKKTNELHILCQSRSNKHLSQAVQSFTIRLAKAINMQLKRSGAVFWGRYRLEIIYGRQSFRKIKKQLDQSLQKIIENLKRRSTDHPPPRNVKKNAQDLLMFFLKIKRLTTE